MELWLLDGRLLKDKKKESKCILFILCVCVGGGGSLQATRHNFLIKAGKHLGKSPMHKMRKKPLKRERLMLRGRWSLT